MGQQESTNNQDQNQQQPEGSFSIDRSLLVIGQDAIFIKKINNISYGEAKILKSQKLETLWAVKQRMFDNYNEYQEFIREEPDIRYKFDCEYLVKLFRIYKTSQQELCSNFYKIYMAFDYYPNNLKEQIEYKKRKNLPFSQASLFKILHNVLSALIYLDDKGINHENLMAQAILIDNQKKKYLLTDSKFMTGLTLYTQFIMGSISETMCCYLSPEQINCLKHRQKIPVYSKDKSDIYSLGLCVLEAGILEQINDIYDFDSFSINEEVLIQKLSIIKQKYSEELYDLLVQILQSKEVSRISLQEALQKTIHFQNQLGLLNNNQALNSKDVDNTFLTSKNFINEGSNHLTITPANIKNKDISPNDISLNLQKPQPSLINSQLSIISQVYPSKSTPDKSFQKQYIAHQIQNKNDFSIQNKDYYQNKSPNLNDLLNTNKDVQINQEYINKNSANQKENHNSNRFSFIFDENLAFQGLQEMDNLKNTISKLEEKINTIDHNYQQQKINKQNINQANQNRLSQFEMFSHYKNPEVNESDIYPVNQYNNNKQKRFQSQSFINSNKLYQNNNNNNLDISNDNISINNRTNQNIPYEKLASFKLQRPLLQDKKIKM